MGRILRVIDLVGSGFDPHMHQLLPAVIKLLGELEEVGVKREAIVYLEKLCRRVTVAEYASSLVHPLIRIIEAHAELRMESMAVCIIITATARIESAIHTYTLRRREKALQATRTREIYGV